MFFMDNLYGLKFFLMLTSAVFTSRPNFTVPPPSIIFWTSGRGGLAECKASGSPTPKMEWVDLDGKVLETIPGLRHILEDGTMVLAGYIGNKLDPTPLIAICRASNKDGIVMSRPMSIELVNDQVLQISVEQLSLAKAGMNLVLRCDVNPKIRNDVTINWYKDDILITQGRFIIDSRWLIGADGILAGKSLEHHDLMSSFFCAVSTTSSPTVQLKRNDIDILPTQDILHIEAKAGDTVLLPCLVESDREHIVSWFKNQDSGDLRERGGSNGLLVFDAVETYHSGNWICRSGELNKTVHLFVYQPLQVSVTPKIMNLLTGESGKLYCNIPKSNHLIKYVKWWREGVHLIGSDLMTSFNSENTLTSILDIGPVNTVVAGFYQCMVMRDYESVVVTAQVVIADTDPMILDMFKSMNVSIGDYIALKCSATGQPTPKIVWYQDGIILNHNHKYYLSETIDGNTILSWLNITILDIHDGGKFVCNASNPKGTSIHEGRVNVKGSPSIRHLSTLHIISDGAASVFCPYLGHPISTVLWRRIDGGLIDGNSPQIVGEKLTVRSSGLYSCEAFAPDGEFGKRTVEIVIHKQPKLAKFMFPEGLFVGASVQASCALTDSTVGPISFSWYKDGRPIPASHLPESTLMQFFSILVLASLKSSDRGNYTCIASNNYGTDTVSNQLYINEQPTWKKMATNISVLAGSSVIVACEVNGYPRPVLTWDISNSSTGTYEPAEAIVGTAWIQLSDGSGWIKTVTPDHEGWYRCSANGYNNITIRQQFFVTVNEPPKVEGVGPNIIYAIFGSRVTMICIAKGEKTMTSRWIYNFNSQNESDFAKNRGDVKIAEIREDNVLHSNLTILAVRNSHNGNYTCRIFDTYGDALLHYHLIVQDIPFAPTDLMYKDLAPHSVILNWRRPLDSNSAISHYIVQFAKYNVDFYEGLWFTLDISNKTVPAVEHKPSRYHSQSRPVEYERTTLFGLQAYTRYVARIAAINKVGMGPWSNNLFFNTAEEIPSMPPRNIHVHTLNNRDIQVTWQPPLDEAWNGDKGGYIVNWWTVPADLDKRIHEATIDNAKVLRYIIRNTHAATKYGITVSSYNRIGRGLPSAEFNVITKEAAPEGPPRSVRCYTVSPTSIRITWEPIMKNLSGGAPLHYSVRYCRMNPFKIYPDITAQGYDLTVKHLAPYLEYGVQIRGSTKEGDGPFSSLVTCITMEHIPGPPQAIKIFPTGIYEARASWLPPIEPNGRIITYTFYIRELGDERDANATKVSPSSDAAETTIGVRNLKPGHVYEAWVKAHTSAGDGATSAIVVVETSLNVPARIASFPDIVSAQVGENVFMRCSAFGTPPIKKGWFRGQDAISSRGPFHVQGDGLAIRPVALEDSDKYVCKADNYVGRDSISVDLVVLLPPLPPDITLLLQTRHALEIDIRPPTSPDPKHAQTTSYILFYRHDNDEEWNSEAVFPGPHYIDGLTCGSIYHFYGAATTGTAGEPKAFRTSGGPPVPPSDNSWLDINNTAVRADSKLWDENRCGAVQISLVIEGFGELELNPGDVHTFSLLEPGKWYKAKAIGTNEAGSVTVDLEFATPDLDGKIPPPPTVSFVMELPETLTLLFIIFLVVFLAIIIACRFCRKKRSAEVVVQHSHSDSITNGACEATTYNRQTNDMEMETRAETDVYEIEPYATYTGSDVESEPVETRFIRSGISGNYTLQLHSYPRRDEEFNRPSCSEFQPCCIEDDVRVKLPYKRRRPHRPRPVYYRECHYIQESQH